MLHSASISSFYMIGPTYMTYAVAPPARYENPRILQMSLPAECATESSLS